MSKLIMLSGLPASGKSTKSDELLAVGNTVRLNRDLLREMLHCNKFTGKNEGLTVDAEQVLALSFLRMGMNVIVDDCNLNPKNKDMWKNVAKEAGSKFEHIHIDTDWVECITRDVKREKCVGGDVIKNMALQYGLIKFAKDSLVLCDLDGTLCDISHRLPLVNPGIPDTRAIKGEDGKLTINENPPLRKDWANFFAGISKDKIRQDTYKTLVDLYNAGKQVIFVSARPDTYKKQTLKWLRKHNATFAFTLIMRKGNDKRLDTEVKKEILDRYFPDKSCIHTVIDDRPSVIRMWRENGLKVIDVGDGKEF